MFTKGDKVKCISTCHSIPEHAKFITIGEIYTVRLEDDEMISLEEIDFVGMGGPSMCFWFDSKDFEVPSARNDAYKRAMGIL